MLPFVLGFCLSVLGFFFFLVWLLSSFFFFVITFQFFKFLIIKKIFYFNYFILLFFSFFLSFILPFLMSCVPDRVVLLQPGVRPVPLRWESRVQNIAPSETSQLHAISNGKSSPRDLHLNTKTQLHSTTSKLQCWTPYAKQLARQKHNPTC